MHTGAAHAPTTLESQEYLKTWRPDLVDREMFKLVTINGGLNNQIPGGAGLFAVSVSISAGLLRLHQCD